MYKRQVHRCLGLPLPPGGGGGPDDPQRHDHPRPDGGQRQDALGPDIIAGGIVAQGELFPDVEKQLGIAGAAEQKVCLLYTSLFEMLVLEGMQAGLSWLTILNKRAAFKEAFNEFD